MGKQEEIWAGQSINIALQIKLAQAQPMDEDKFIKELFVTAKAVFEGGKKAGFLTWGGASQY